jgi:hypothetical protein
MRQTRDSIPAVPMPPKKSSKSSNLQVVSSYDHRKVHIPYVCENGTSTYQPRSAPKKAAILRESLLTLAKQKQQQRQRQQAGNKTRSTDPVTTVPQTPEQPKQPKQQVPPRPTKPQKVQTLFKNVSRSADQRMELRQQNSAWPLILEEEEEPEKDSDNENEEEGEEREEDTNEDLQLARDVLRASDKFKDHRMRQVLQGAANDVRRAYPDDLTTSDIQDHLEDIVGNAQLQADYPIELYTLIRLLREERTYLIQQEIILIFQISRINLLRIWTS